ncbi:MAG TPA: phosphoribosyltransferase family protein [Caldilineaceae bacterium]|nr:phosphoribosyltransferase family protein [Caldilineaceae bacterium]
MGYDGRVYPVEIGGLRRDLPIFEVAPKVKIAIFNMLGDTAIVERAAELLAAQLPAGADVLVTPEVKAVPLGHAISARSGLPYVVVRKIRKPYMANCLEAQVVSITTGQPQTLYLDGKDRHLVEGKRAVLVDDVISTGSTLRGLRLLMDQAHARIVGEMAVFTEGNGADWSQVIALGHLPIFSD